MMDGAPADLQELVRLPDVLVVCSSRGWTDEKHMLYLQLLEETFVSKLHDGEHSFTGLFNLPLRYCGHVKSSKQILEYGKPDQGCHGIVDDDRVKSCMNAELMDSPSCCGNQQDGKVDSMEDNASSTEPVEEAVSQARAASSGQSSTCYVGKHRHSPSRSAAPPDGGAGAGAEELVFLAPPAPPLGSQKQLLLSQNSSRSRRSCLVFGIAPPKNSSRSCWSCFWSCPKRGLT